MNQLMPDYNRTSSASKLDSVLSINGRLGRMSYLAWIFAVSAVFSVVALTISCVFVLSALAAEPLDSSILNTIDILIFTIIFAILVALLYFIVVFSIRRLHDLNQPGWLSLLLIVPAVNFIFGLYLALAKGSSTPNDYGAQRITQGWEKILVWAPPILVILSFSLPPAFNEALTKILP